LAGAEGLGCNGRAHFFAVRDAGALRVTLNDQLAIFAGQDTNLLALDDGLSALAKWDARKARVVELRFFGGLSVEETGAVLKISPQSVLRDWRLAKAWLARELGRSEANAS
jgi:RNA polymerase sigma-70 factor, ECF subfamily